MAYSIKESGVILLDEFSVSCVAKLILDEPQAVYYSGQLLTGCVELKLDQPIHLAAINVTFLGQATVDWSEVEIQGNGSRNVHYKGRETYFDFTDGILGTNGQSPLHSGTHNFPFQFQIPPTAPSSFKSSSGFKGVLGKVSYSVKAQIMYGDGRDKNGTKPFKVVAPLDFNKGSEDIKKPVTLEFEETYSCCFSSSPICVTVSLPQSGFCPGEDIPIKVTSINDSSIEIKGMLLQLIQKECYHSMQPRSEWVPPETVIAVVKSGSVLSNTSKETVRLLRVPDMIAPNLQHCSIIDIGFFLKVTIKLSGCNNDLEDEAEICLGLVPLNTSETAEKYVHPMKYKLPQAPIPGIENMPLAPPTKTYTESSMSNVGYAQPYPSSTAPYSTPYVPSSATTVPQPSIAPYPNSDTPLLSSNSAYQSSTAPYPNSAAPYPNSAAPYPKNSAAPYPNSSPPNLNSTAPYPISATPYPNSAAPYPNSAAPYPTTTTPYQVSSMPYPSSDMPYPNSPMSNQVHNPPYPIEGIPVPSLRTGNIGFAVPQSHGMPSGNAPYPTGNRAHSPLPPQVGNTMPSAPSCD